MNMGVWKFFGIFGALLGLTVLAYMTQTTSKHGLFAAVTPPLTYFASVTANISRYYEEQKRHEEKCHFSRPQENCTFQLLSEYSQHCDYFATKTTWQNSSLRYPQASVITKTCSLQENLTQQVPAEGLQKFIDRRNVRHIVLFGDSQGKRYLIAFIHLIQRVTFHCDLMKKEKEGFDVGLDYYIDDLDPSLLVPVQRTCQSCTSMLFLCRSESGRELKVEYISMVMNADTRIRATKDYCKTNPSHPLCTSTTQQQFIFKDYFSRANFPDLLLVFTTFAHDRDRLFAVIQRGTKELFRLMDTYVPATSTVIWYTTTPFHKDKMYPNLYGLILENGYRVNEKILVLNHLLFHELQPRLIKRADKPEMYAFFDLYQLQLELNQEWSLDWVHSEPSWYKTVLAHTMAMLAQL